LKQCWRSDCTFGVNDAIVSISTIVNGRHWNNGGDPMAQLALIVELLPLAHQKIANGSTFDRHWFIIITIVVIGIIVTIVAIDMIIAIGTIVDNDDPLVTVNHHCLQ
jgi:hypothetical protein